MDWKNTVVRITKEVRREIQLAGEEITDRQAAEMTEERVLNDPELEEADFRMKVRIVNQIFYTLRRDMGILEPLLQDDDISEIMVNGTDSIYIEKKGKTEKMEMAFASTEELQEVIRRIGARVYREINERTPILDARLPDGSRVNAVYSNVALDGPVLTIRKFPEKPLTMDHLIRTGTITQEAAGFLQKLVLAGFNIFISGGTSSGKTTFLNILSQYIPSDQRIIVIEDSAELQLERSRNLVRLECRNANGQGKGQIEMNQLIRTSLRMRPDRIVVGEVRGGEVVDMIQAIIPAMTGVCPRVTEILRKGCFIVWNPCFFKQRIIPYLRFGAKSQKVLTCLSIWDVCLISEEWYWKSPKLGKWKEKKLC